MILDLKDLNPNAKEVKTLSSPSSVEGGNTSAPSHPPQNGVQVMKLWFNTLVEFKCFPKCPHCGEQMSLNELSGSISQCFTSPAKDSYLTKEQKKKKAKPKPKQLSKLKVKKVEEY